MARRRHRQVLVFPKLINETGIRTDDLTRLVRKALISKGAIGEIRYPIDVVRFYVSKNWQSRGWADPDPGIVSIAIAKGWNGEEWETREIAQLLDHEIDHMLGLDHGDMYNPWWWQVDASWADGLPIRLRVGQEPDPVEVKIRCLFDLLYMRDESGADAA